MNPLDHLLAEIRRLETRLGEVRDEESRLEAELTQLRAQIADATRPTDDRVAEAALPLSWQPTESTPTTPEAKVALFGSLFRGRDDVFARRWENSRTGRSGYAPACSNEWHEFLCDKKNPSRRPKKGGSVCGECRNQAFVGLSDGELRGHLEGRQVIGVYPMLKDERCWFLAVDFDGPGWQDDITAFRSACETEDVHVAVERSRSGNGGHAWFFFSDPVPSAAARQLGCHLLTEAMARRHDIAMASYDRLFPNQDTMPKGGFGNLIALPLQWQARQCGNSLFVDRDLRPYDDQWDYLAAVRRMDPATVHQIADRASRSSSVIAARPVEDDGDAAAPWRRQPSGQPPPLTLQEPLPSPIPTVLAQRLFVDITNLPSPLVSRLKRVASFQNPEFYKKQAMRLSTALTPRVISCFEREDRHLALPRGCLDGIDELFASLGAALDLQDERQPGEHSSFTFHGHLRPEQERAVAALREHDTGVLVAPPGAGKTVMAAWMIAARATNTLVLTHRKPLLQQWVARLAAFLGVSEKEIGRVGGGTRRVTGRLDVAMLQSVVQKGRVDDLVASYGHVVVDECHHIAAASFERALAEVKARFVLGLTATPQRRDGHQPILHMQLGPVRHTVRRAELNPSTPKLVVRETGFVLPNDAADPPIHELYRRLATDDDRNALIIRDLGRALDEGRSPILLTERRDHLDELLRRLEGRPERVIVLRGGMTSKRRAAAMAELAEHTDPRPRVVLATGRFIGEGFDDARLDTLILALPVSWKGTLVQYAGRLNRPYEGKPEIRVYDYVDRQVPTAARMFERRLRGYRMLGFERSEANDAEPAREPAVCEDRGP